MRFSEIDENGRVRYVLPAELAGEYQVLPPNAVEIALDAEVSEGDVIDQAAVTAADRAAFEVERARLFVNTGWIRERHADRVEMSIDDAANWTAWLNYWQALRDMPDAEGFDAAVPVWPEKPE